MTEDDLDITYLVMNVVILQPVEHSIPPHSQFPMRL